MNRTELGTALPGGTGARAETRSAGVGRQAQTPCLPRAFYHALDKTVNWFGSLESSGTIAAAPTRHDSKALQKLFVDFWTATGMDASLGLARATPDHRLFRTKLGGYFWQSPQVRRCFEKPRGYAGDYLMMDAMCNQPPKASTLTGEWLERWFRDSFPPFIAVRNRRDYMARLLREEQARGARRILNVACGGAPELAASGLCSQFEEIVLLDQDAEALEFARARLGGKDGDAGSGHVRTVCASIQALTESLPSGLRRYDVVYSMGLYDYLPQRRARALTKVLWERVAPGGILVVGNFQGHHWSRYAIEAVMDWFVLYRDPDDLTALASELAGGCASVVDDATGLLHMLQVRRT